MDIHGSAVAARPGFGTSDHRHEPSPRRRNALWYVVGILAILASGGGIFYWFQHAGHGAKTGHETQGSAAQDAQSGATRVEVARPRKGGLERTTTQAGSVHAFEHADLFSKVSGYLKVQNVDIGDSVKIGQLLAEIDDPEIQKAVDQAKAALDQAKARTMLVAAQIQSAEAERDAAQAMVHQSEAEVATSVSTRVYRGKQLARIQGLVQKGATEAKLADEEIDKHDAAVAAEKVADAAVLAARATVASKQAKVEEAKADLVEAKAKVQVAEADLAKARVWASYTEIRSPYDGVISLRTYHRGDFIHSAAEGKTDPLLSVDRVDLMRVVLPIPDREVRFLGKDDLAVVKIDALPDREFRGKVSRFAMVEDPESRNMRTEVDIPNPDGALHPGMYGAVTVILQQATPFSVTVPSSCLISQTGGGAGTVYVVSNGKAIKKKVRVSKDNGTEAEIDEGLTVDDLVIVRYSGVIGDGSPVQAEAAQPSRAGH